MGKRQQKFTSEYKARVVLEVLKGRKTMAQISSEFGVHSTQIANWKKQALTGLKEVFSSKKGVQGSTETAKMDNLYKQIGKLQVECDFLKQAVYPDAA
jgi:putative transposase